MALRKKIVGDPLEHTFTDMCVHFGTRLGDVNSRGEAHCICGAWRKTPESELRIRVLFGIKSQNNVIADVFGIDLDTASARVLRDELDKAINPATAPFTRSDNFPEGE